MDTVTVQSFSGMQWCIEVPANLIFFQKLSVEEFTILESIFEEHFGFWSRNRCAVFADGRIFEDCGRHEFTRGLEETAIGAAMLLVERATIGTKKHRVFEVCSFDVVSRSEEERQHEFAHLANNHDCGSNIIIAGCTKCTPSYEIKEEWKSGDVSIYSDMVDKCKVVVIE